MAAKSDKKTPTGEILVCRNSKATQRYEIEERVEAGLVLVGSEVKSMRLGRGDLEGAFATIDSAGEMFLHRFYVPPYEATPEAFAHDPRRTRKLLLKATEIDKWRGRVTMRGYTIVPMRVYFKKGWAKVELGLGRGKQLGDDREKIRREADMKDARAAMRSAKR